MPLNLSDEALDEFDTLSDDERKAIARSLNDADLGVLGDALEKRRKSRTLGTITQEARTEYNLPLAVEAPQLERVASGEKPGLESAGLQMSVANPKDLAAQTTPTPPDPTDPLNYPMDLKSIGERALKAREGEGVMGFLASSALGPPGLGIFSGESALRESVVDPLVRRAQEFQHKTFGEPQRQIRQSLIRALGTKLGMSDDMLAAVELLDARAGQAFEGEPQATRRQTLPAVRGLEEISKKVTPAGAAALPALNPAAALGGTLGPKLTGTSQEEFTAGALESGAVAAGQLPLEIPGMLVGASEGQAASKLLSLLSPSVDRAVLRGAFGALEAGAQAAVSPAQGAESMQPERQSIPGAMTMGFGVGAAFSGGADVIRVIADRRSTKSILTELAHAINVGPPRQQMAELAHAKTLAAIDPRGPLAAQQGYQYLSRPGPERATLVQDQGSALTAPIVTKPAALGGFPADVPTPGTKDSFVHIMDPTLEPTVSFVANSEGRAVGVVVEMHADGTRRFAIEPLDTIKGARRFIAVGNRADSTVIVHPDLGDLNIPEPYKIVLREEVSRANAELVARRTQRRALGDARKFSIEKKAADAYYIREELPDGTIDTFPSQYRSREAAEAGLAARKARWAAEAAGQPAPPEVVVEAPRGMESAADRTPQPIPPEFMDTEIVAARSKVPQGLSTLDAADDVDMYTGSVFYVRSNGKIRMQTIGPSYSDPGAAPKVGDTVEWTSDEGRTFTGVVVDRDPTGKLHVQIPPGQVNENYLTGIQSLAQRPGRKRQVVPESSPTKTVASQEPAQRAAALRNPQITAPKFWEPTQQRRVVMERNPRSGREGTHITMARPERVVPMDKFIPPGDVSLLRRSLTSEGDAIVKHMGPDPNSSKHTLFQTRSGQVVSLPNESTTTVSLATKAPKTLLPPPPAKVPAPMSAQDLPPLQRHLADVIARMHQAAAKARIPHEGIRKLLSPVNYQLLFGSDELAQKLLLEQGLRQVQAFEELHNATRRMFKNHGEYSQFSRDLENVIRTRKLVGSRGATSIGPGKPLGGEAGIKGATSLDAFWAKWGNTPAGVKMKEFINSAFMELDRIQAELAARGVIMPELDAAREAGLMDSYAATDYRAHFLAHGDYAKIQHLDEIRDAAAFLMAQNPKMSPDQIFTQLRWLQRMDNVDARFKDFQQSSMGAAWKHLKSKSELPLPLAKFLGRETSGFITLASSITNARVVLQNARLWDSVVATPEAFSKGVQRLTADGRPFIPVPNIKERFGAAAGEFIHPDLEQLITGPQRFMPHETLIYTLLQLRKGGLTVFGGPRPWINNFIRNFKGMMIAGTDLRDLYHAAQALREWRKLPFDAKGDSIVALARQWGVLSKGFAMTELGSTQFMDDLFKEMAKPGHYSSHAGVFAAQTSIAGKIKRGARGAHDNVRAAYDSIDNMAKLATFMTELRRTGDAAEAAARVKLLFADFENVGPALEKFRHSGGGLAAAPFFTGVVENYRVDASIPQYVKRAGDEAHLRIGQMFLGLQLFALAINEARKANGITDEHVRASVDGRRLSKQYYSKGLIALPFLDEKGRVQLLNTSSWIDEAQLLNGNPRDSVAANVAFNFIMQTQGEMTDKVFREMASDAGLMEAEPDYSPTFHGDRTVMNVFAELAKSGYLGTAWPARVHEDLRAGGYVGALRRNEERLTPTQTGARLLGVPLTTPYTVPREGVVSPTHKSARQEVRMERKDLNKERLRVQRLKRPENVSVEEHMERKRMLRDAVRERIELNRARKAELYDIYEAVNKPKP